jgi:cell division protein FtsW
MALVAIPAAIAVVLVSPYRRARLMTFLDPSADSQGSGYQIKQSLISFANGGLTGSGIGQGKQKFLFLPEPFTDFIYSIIGEELGFIGAVFVLILFVIFLFRAMKIARTAPDMYGFYIGMGITISIVGYALINAGVATGLFPTTGLPMPFISYGGSSLLFTCFTVGVLLNISSQTVPKEDAMKRTTKEKISEQFTKNFDLDDTTQETLLPKDAVVEKKVTDIKKPATRPSIVGMDLSD